MRETVTKDELKYKIISILRDDDRAAGYLAAIFEAIQIVESAGVTQSNWQLSLNTAAEVPEATKEAVFAAAEAAQSKWRIDLPPLGMSARPLF